MKRDPQLKVDLQSPNGSLANSAKKKKQLVLISFLLGILLIAIATSPSSEKSPHDDLHLNSTSLVSMKPSAATAASNASDHEPPRQYLTSSKLPTNSREQILAVDLFKRLPIELPVADTTEVTPSESIADDFQVGAIYGSFAGREHSALIDGEIVQVGETLDSGERVLGISSEGVQLAP